MVFLFVFHMSNPSKSFTKKLLLWHKDHARDLPWKKDKDPYKIWVSEIIMQQTRVAQGLPYYLRFINRFPKLEHLAIATEDELMQVWQGLGYYSRARNMHHAAKYIYFELQGLFPDNYTDLLKLKGTGPYTAAAISSFAFNEPRAVVDGNVIRVLSRIFAIDIAFDSSPGKKLFATKASSLLDKSVPGDYNQAIMDFGATVCLPGNPDCTHCPFVDMCLAKKTDRIAHLPVKSKTLTRKHRYFIYHVARNAAGQYLVEKRTAKDIWEGLYQFPLQEVDSEKFNDSFEPVLPFKINELIHNEHIEPVEIIEQKQLLTHQKIHAKFVIYNIQFDKITFPKNIYLVDYENLCNFAFPKIIDWFIEEKLISL